MYLLVFIMCLVNFYLSFITLCCVLRNMGQRKQAARESQLQQQMIDELEKLINTLDKIILTLFK